jgi:nucleoside-diphosphate-sugar epimerase
MTTGTALPGSEAELEELLSRPAPADVAAAAAWDGGLMVLGAGGKMGPSLVRLAQRALDAAGRRGPVYAVSRFSQRGLAEGLASDGIVPLKADLLDPTAVAALPDAPHVILMAGHKFGSTAEPDRTWATNVLLPADAARRYRASRLVAFSTGNVYPLTPVDGTGPTEDDPTGPVGEYAQSALARERILTNLAVRHGSPLSILRLNYAVEPRYGVLRDIADLVRAGRPVPLAMGHVNVIWQRDANAVALRALAHARVPPLVLNLTGTGSVAVRALAEAFGRRFGVTPSFTGVEADTALLSNARRCAELFGPPAMPLDRMVELVAGWIETGGSSLGKPTHFEEREGSF